MKNSYFDLIDQSYTFPQGGFDLAEGYLTFHGVSLKYLVEKYGTPFKLMYLPRIGEQIQRARDLFNAAIDKANYGGRYYYAYCTKCSHFSHVIKTALREGIQLETSSAFDIDLIYKLYQEGDIDQGITIIHNGYKTDEYLDKIALLNKDGFENSIIILDSKSELTRVKQRITGLGRRIKIGIRMAIDEEPQTAYYTSRLGIRANEIIAFYKNEIHDDHNIRLEMMHFYIDSGIKDNLYYWGEFQKAMNLFVDLAEVCPDLRAIDLGGGFPIQNQLAFDYDYQSIINQLVGNIAEACRSAKVAEPDIYTEFGRYTVGESGATIFSVLEQKTQNDTEMWYMVDNSLMNTIPDAWSMNEKFLMLPINKWDHEYTRVNIGGISCDHSDYYNSEDMNQQLFLPKYATSADEPLYIGFFHTGAYQDAISGYGGIKHCLIPSPKIIIIDKDDTGNYVDTVYRNEQTVEEMLKILGY